MEILFGSKAREKTEKINYPMIVLTHEPVNSNIQDIVLAVDMKEPNQIGVDQVIGFSQLMNAHLHLLHLIVNSNDINNKAIDALHSFAKNKNLNKYSINLISSQSIEDGPESFVNVTKPDMIALVNPGKGKLDRMIFGDKNQRSESETELPVFICETA